MELGLTGRYLGKRYEHNWFGYYPNVRVGLSEQNQKEMPELAAAGQLLHPAALVWSASAHYDVTEAAACRSESPQYLLRILYEKDGYHMPGRRSSSLHPTASKFKQSLLYRKGRRRLLRLRRPLWLWALA